MAITQATRFPHPSTHWRDTDPKTQGRTPWDFLSIGVHPLPKAIYTAAIFEMVKITVIVDELRSTPGISFHVQREKTQLLRQSPTYASTVLRYRTNLVHASSFVRNIYGANLMISKSKQITFSMPFFVVIYHHSGQSPQGYKTFLWLSTQKFHLHL